MTCTVCSFCGNPLDFLGDFWSVIVLFCSGSARSCFQCDLDVEELRITKYNEPLMDAYCKKSGKYELSRNCIPISQSFLTPRYSSPILTETGID